MLIKLTMLKSKHPKSPVLGKNKKEGKHWSHRLHESIVSAGPEGLLNLVIKGGSENGQFCYIGDIRQDKINYHSGKLHPDEIIIEIQGQKVAGYTLRDLLAWLKQVSRNGSPVMFKTVKAGQLTKDLRQYLNARFQKNSLDHDLQQTIRDNLYMRTVPCTTRQARPGEVNGVDYTFLTVEEFMALEKSGNLLESGLYDGNQYGTPKPPKDPVQPAFRRTNSASTLLPGPHPSSEGKRRRNRSNVETTSSAKSSPTHHADDSIQPMQRKRSLERAHSTSSLGPLPPNWELAYTEDGTQYFIDHSTETTHWLDPRIAAAQKSGPSECDEDELPYGWEKVEDPHYGTYYIDHVNRKTQYENPVAQAKKAAQETAVNDKDQGSQTKGDGDESSTKRTISEADMNGAGASLPGYTSHKLPFTRNPEELKGEFLKTYLVKSPRGFGFTIVGGDDTDEEFLQIKNVVEGGPAFVDGHLKTGDVLVYVNDVCVLGYTHQDVVSMFQKIPPGQKVRLEVCRGYPLPFDPNDPNTEIVTTVAVTLPPTGTTNTVVHSNLNNSRTDAEIMNLTQRSIKSMPDLANMQHGDNHVGNRNKSYDELRNGNNGDVLNLFPSSSKPELLTINVVKGAMGFGFTIADSAYGQKVKQILDKARCKNLLEGDILVQINKSKVKDLSHQEVVQVLKDCPKGREAAILIQRGGMLTPRKGRKPGDRSPRMASMEDAKSRNMSDANVPRSPFYSPDMQDANLSAEDPVNPAHLSNRSKTPTIGGGSDSRPKTPNSQLKSSVNRSPVGDRTGDLVNRHPGYDPRVPPSELPNSMQPGTAQLPGGRDYHLDSSKNGAYRHVPSDMYGGRLDYSMHGYNPTRKDMGGAGDYGANSDRSDYLRDPSQKLYRSRTPGPEMMRGRSELADDPYMRSRTPTAQEMRSKTPTHDMYRSAAHQQPYTSRNLSGTPDFIPASVYQQQQEQAALGLPNHQNSPHYQSPQQRAQDVNLRNKMDNGPYDRRQRPVSGPDFVHSYGGAPYSSTATDRLNTSQTFTASLNNYAAQNSRNLDTYPGLSPRPNQSQFTNSPPGVTGGRPKKQSTSFEHEEPSPGNLTRVPRNDRFGGTPSGSPASTLNRSHSPHRSPARFGEEERYMELTVFLTRQESGFGFRIIGGTEEGSQVSVGHIVPGGSADVDARLRTGDEIIYVDGQSVIGASHHKVVQLMSSAALAGRVSLGVRRRIPPSTGTDSPYRGPGGQETYPYEVTVTRRQNEGFGFVIISSVTRAGSTVGELIGRIIENSPAERCGKLHVGDRILAVNNIDIGRMHHEDIVNIIKESGFSCTLTVGPPQDDASSTASTSQRSSQGSMINAMAYPAVSESDLSHRSDYSPYHQPIQTQAPSGPNNRYQQDQILQRHKELVRQRTFNSQGDSLVEEDKFYAVELHRGSRGFGFSIRGGREFNSMPLYVLRIADGGAADLDSRLKVGDQIIEINGYNTNNMTHAEAIDIIQNGGSTVRLLVKRTGKPPPQMDANQTASGKRTPTTGLMPNGPISQPSPAVSRHSQESRDPYYYDRSPDKRQQQMVYR